MTFSLTINDCTMEEAQAILASVAGGASATDKPAGRRKKADATAAPAPAAPAPAAPAPAAPAPAAPAPAAAPTIDDVRQVVMDCSAAIGTKATVGVIRETCGVAKVVEVKPESYAPLIAALNEAKDSLG